MTSMEERYSVVNLLKRAVFWTVHGMCLFIIWAGFSWQALTVCLAMYLIRMFAITGGYHRYFSHRSYTTSRLFQFILAWVGACSCQKGPLWWAGHHRHHHKYSDTEEDVHSPGLRGIWYAHVGWVMSTEFVQTRLDLVKDLAKFPELRFIDKFHLVPPILLAVAIFYFGAWVEYAYPASNTSAFQMLIWGFFLSTVLLYHGTFCINSFCHLIGNKRFNTSDESKNSFFLALITLGEGWHNNHHRYPGSEKQGFYWWEIDLSHYVLKVLSWLGLVWDLRVPPERIYREAREVPVKS